MSDSKQERQQLYWVWWEMKRRCRDPRSPQFKDYGGRGITVCERWVESFQAFLVDMGPRPKGGQVDRVDNDGNYSPSNCKWSTRQEQTSNRRNCIYVCFSGETITLKEACRRAGLKYRPVHKRITARGWDIERALSTPIGIGNKHANISTPLGVMALVDYAPKIGLTRDAAWMRLNRGKLEGCVRV